MKNTYWIFIVLFCFSCKTKKEILKPLESDFYGEYDNSDFMVGRRFNITKDSFFYSYSTCMSRDYSKGTWTIKDSFLILTSEYLDSNFTIEVIEKHLNLPDSLLVFKTYNWNNYFISNSEILINNETKNHQLISGDTTIPTRSVDDERPPLVRKWNDTLLVDFHGEKIDSFKIQFGKNYSKSYVVKNKEANYFEIKMKVLTLMDDFRYRYFNEEKILIKKDRLIRGETEYLKDKN